MDQIGPTPRNAILGLLADALTGVDAYANKPDPKGGKANPIAGLLSDFLGVGSVGRTADRMSYGLPVTQGTGQTLSMLPDTRDALMAVGPFAAKPLSSARGLLGETASNSMTYGARSAKMRAPPQVNEAGFWNEYQGIKPGAASGERPIFDIDGRPIDPRSAIAGRARVDGDSVGLQDDQINSIIKQLGINVRGVAAKEIGGDAGRYISGGGNRQILLDNNLTADQVPHVMRHELAHGLDDFAGTYVPGSLPAISPKGQTNALARVYDDLNNMSGPSPLGAPRPAKKQATPATDKYKPEDHDAERMAEALRAYITNPAYIKTVEPGLAARLRKAVNENPNLKHIITLNSVAGGGLLGSGLLGQDGTD